MNMIKHNSPCSAISISRRPNSACRRFLMQKSLKLEEVFCSFSRGETSSSSLLDPVYEAEIEKKEEL